MGLKKRYFSILFLFYLFLFSCSSLKNGKFIPSQNEPVSSPFEIHSGLILIKVEINGISGTFLFDNGFSYSGINAAFAEKANVHFEGSTSIRDANNRTNSTPTANVKLVEIQGHKFINTGFYQINTNRFFPCRKIDGVIGASIINQVNWKINFETNELLSSSTPFKEIGFPLDFYIIDNNSSLTKMTVLGQDYSCKIDLGSYNAMQLDLKYTAKTFEGISAEQEEGITSISANGLGDIEKEFMIESRMNVEQNQQSLPVPTKVKLANGLKYQGYLGLDFFKDYHVVIHSNDRKYWLQPRDTLPKQKPDSTYGLGIYLIEDKWKVININPNDSFVANIPLMSEVTSIDSLSMKQFTTICDYKNYLKKKKRTPLKLTLRENNRELTIPYHQKVYGRIRYQ